MDWFLRTVLFSTPNGTPYGGAPTNVPGIIEAEHYDNGGEGIAYHDVDATINL